MKDLFGNDVLQIGNKPKEERTAVFQYKQLIAIYGKTPGEKCKNCINCNRHNAGSKYFYKCHLAKISHSQATDWNSRWAACGKFINMNKILLITVLFFGMQTSAQARIDTLSRPAQVHFKPEPDPLSIDRRKYRINPRGKKKPRTKRQLKIYDRKNDITIGQLRPVTDFWIQGV